MSFELQALSKPGQRFVELAQAHAAEARSCAASHDRDGSFPFEIFDAMKQSGFMSATVPEEFGGLGLTSAHDMAIGFNRLGRGDGSTAIAAHMHLAFGLIGSQLLRSARIDGDEDMANRLAGLLALFGGGAVGMANVTEAGTDILHPLVEASKVDGGWSITGRKIFSTLSPIADIFYVTLRTATSAEGQYASQAAFVPRGTPGQTIADNWDALGMRASASNDVVYEDCTVPDEFVMYLGPWGEESVTSLLIASLGNIGLVAVFLGIAESARDLVVDMARTRRKAPSNRPVSERGGIQRAVAEMEVKLSGGRGFLAYVGRLLDQYVTATAAPPSIDLLHRLNKEFQSAKLVVNRSAIEVVDLALAVSGGAGYLSSNVLSRLYRDVRAGPFMQPLSPIEAHEYIGKVALGLEPKIDV